MDKKRKLLIVDDDLEMVQTLSILVTTTFPNFDIYAANDANSAFEIISEKMPDLLLSDIMMPGMDGFQLTEKIRSTYNFDQIYIILFTGAYDQANIKKIIDCGANDFILKPFGVDELTARVRNAMTIADLNTVVDDLQIQIIKKDRLLANHLNDIKNISAKILQARIPALISMFEKIALAAVSVSKEHGDFIDKQINDIELASLFCYAGKIYLPDDKIKIPVMTDGIPTEELMFSVPNSARDIISSVDSLKDSATLLFHIYENFDGTGIPDKLQTWQIPMGSRILRVSLDYYEMLYIMGKNRDEALEIIAKNSNRLYDPKIVTLFTQYILGNKDDGVITDKPVKIFQLEPGMILSCDIVTNSGFKLVTAGNQLTESLIKKIISINTTDPIIGNIIIKL